MPASSLDSIPISGHYVFSYTKNTGPFHHISSSIIAETFGPLVKRQLDSAWLVRASTSFWSLGPCSRTSLKEPSSYFADASNTIRGFVVDLFGLRTAKWGRYQT